MSQEIKDVIDNVKEIFMSDSALQTLLDFERVIAELDIYAFSNWKKGELVRGPVSEKYFITCEFMWPFSLMPDPRGGERLLEYDCEITYKKSHVTYPVKVEAKSDFEPNTHFPKKGKAKVWLVTIVMPRDLIDEIQQGSIELEDENLDMEEIEKAYQDGTDEEDLQNDEENAGQEENEMDQEGDIQSMGSDQKQGQPQ